ncbi:peptide ABC transporter [Ensifer sp. Root31]|uniref:ABC transporter permease n=1 Tax=Ensifer sp. Root31 TaxID=1736512 RepID=UPI00070DD1FA|nr:ABC transporter permease [Ensifer sp. Root31]KQU86345.1 peptide ABC transporter [Ensifer sp. Root31]
MLRVVLSRLLETLPVLAVVTLAVFLLLRLSPGDPAATLAGDSATPEMIASMRQKLGLDEPLSVQFGSWIAQLARGDFGISILSQQPVLTMVGQRVEATLSLALVTMVLAMTVSVPVGILAASRQGSAFDRFIMAGTVAGFSIPTFVVGYLLVYIFAIQLRILPVQGFTPIGESISRFLSHIALPTFTLSLVYIALFARTTRAAILEVLSEDYIRTARAKGLGEIAILTKHALRNAAVPIVSVFGIGFAMMIGGVVVTETVFNIPGIGRLVVEAVLARDYPVIQGVILIIASVYIVINLAVDVIYIFLNPKINY